MSEIEDLQQEVRVLSLEMRALRAETTIAITDLRTDIAERFGLLMDAIADLHTTFLGHTHGEDGGVR